MTDAEKQFAMTIWMEAYRHSYKGYSSADQAIIDANKAAEAFKKQFKLEGTK